tara:strand:+ start:821 stop:1276 length:456 start_codon:yes stop_codon:yes gene_type:complete
MRYIWLIILFVSVAMVVDLHIVYPADMNILFPKSLLFYPVIAFFVEIVFHVLPLSLLLAILTFIFKAVHFEKIVWGCFIMVATIEPTYQVLFMDTYPTWAMATTWVNLFLFNMVQLFIFKQNGFISMFLFRIIYYMFWHILWGHFCLGFFF